MIKLIKKWIEQRKEEENKILKLKIYKLRYYITKFFEDLKTTKDSVEFPAWMECKNLMEKLKIDMEHPRIVNHYYKKLQKHLLNN